MPQISPLNWLLLSFLLILMSMGFMLNSSYNLKSFNSIKMKKEGSHKKMW